GIWVRVASVLYPNGIYPRGVPHSVPTRRSSDLGPIARPVKCMGSYRFVHIHPKHCAPKQPADQLVTQKGYPVCKRAHAALRNAVALAHLVPFHELLVGVFVGDAYAIRLGADMHQVGLELRDVIEVDDGTPAYLVYLSDLLH